MKLISDKTVPTNRQERIANKHYKTIFAFLSAIILLPLLWSCSKQLDQKPQTTITDKNFWNTPNDLAIACNYLYSFLPGLNNSGPTGMPAPFEDLYSDDAAGQIGNQVSNGTRLPQASSREWTNFYQLVRAANNILEKSVTVKGDEPVVKKYLGEARFFRAMGYFELLKRFGEVPYISRTLTLEDPMLFTERTPRETMLDSIYADLDFAAANCPLPSRLGTAEYGRITSTAALTFKSRIALFEGCWQKYHGGSSEASHFELALLSSKAVMASGEHQLFSYTGNTDSSYFYLFQYPGEGPANKENILVRLYGQNQANNISAHSYVRSSLERGDISPTRTFMDAYLYTDGLPQGKSEYDSSLSQTSTLTEFRNRDPRIGMTVFNRTDLYPTIFGIVPFSPGIQYRLKKYFIVADWLPNSSFVDFMVIRYAETLLNYAEASYEINGSITDDDLNKSINLLRTRAGMPMLTNALVTSNGLNMLEEIRRERRIELSFEGFRYWDLLRWKTAETELPKAVLGPKYFPGEMADVPGISLTPEGFAIKESASARSFNPQRDYLWPLPTKELGLNPKLTQNPEW